LTNAALRFIAEELKFTNGRCDAFNYDTLEISWKCNWKLIPWTVTKCI